MAMGNGHTWILSFIVCASIIALDVSCFFINLVTFYEREGERGET
jgi:hypothetical protein